LADKRHIQETNFSLHNKVLVVLTALRSVWSLFLHHGDHYDISPPVHKIQSCFVICH